MKNKIIYLMGGVTMADGIVIFGANGSGKTTVGLELAQALSFKHMDVEAYYFEKADIFYANPRSKDEVIRLMLNDIEKHNSFVFSGVTGDYDEKIVSMYKLAVFLSAPIELRMERIKTRAIGKYGNRALPGGDMYEDSTRFIEFAQSRDLSVIDKWAKTLKCPVIHLDATKPVNINLNEIIRVYKTL